jgi:hypothetical protein
MNIAKQLPKSTTNISLQTSESSFENFNVSLQKIESSFENFCNIFKALLQTTGISMPVQPK